MQRRSMHWAILLSCLAAVMGGMLTSCGAGITAPQGLLGSPGGNSGNGGSSGSTGGGATSFFDKSGGTSAFGIPAGMTGTVAGGQGVFNSNCSGCHSSLPVLTYSELKSRLTRSPMNRISLSEQNVVDLVAFLNRNSAPPATGGNGNGGTTGGSGGGGSVVTDGDDDSSGSDADSDDTIGSDSGSDDSMGEDSGTADDSTGESSDDDDSGAESEGGDD